MAQGARLYRANQLARALFVRLQAQPWHPLSPASGPDERSPSYRSRARIRGQDSVACTSPDGKANQDIGEEAAERDRRHGARP